MHALLIQTGKELWNLSLDQSVASIATAAAVDSAGDIWIAGATPLALGLTPPTPAATPVNPDNAVPPASSWLANLTSGNDLETHGCWCV